MTALRQKRNITKPATKEEPMVRTSLALPEALWKAAQHRGIETRTSFRQVLIDALEHYLTIPPKQRER
jgi:hypothetical protein